MAMMPYPDGVMDPRWEDNLRDPQREWGNFPYSPIEQTNRVFDPNVNGALGVGVPLPSADHFEGVKRNENGGIIRSAPPKSKWYEHAGQFAPALGAALLFPPALPAMLALGIGGTADRYRAANDQQRAHEKEASDYQMTRYRNQFLSGDDELQRAYRQHKAEGGQLGFDDFSVQFYANKRTPYTYVDEYGNPRISTPSAEVQSRGLGANAQLPGGTMDSPTGFNRQADQAGAEAESAASGTLQPAAKLKINTLIANNRRSLNRYEGLMEMLEGLPTGPMTGRAKGEYLAKYQIARQAITKNALLFIGALSDMGIRLNPITEEEIKLMFTGQPKIDNYSEANIAILKSEIELINKALGELNDKRDWVDSGGKIEDFPEYNPAAPADDDEPFVPVNWADRVIPGSQNRVDGDPNPSGVDRVKLQKILGTGNK